MAIAIVAVVWALIAGEAMTLDDRLLRFGISVALLGGWMAVTIGNVARLRFFSPADIDAGGTTTDESEPVRRANAILRNTLEQVVLSLCVQAAAVATIPNPGFLIAVLAGLFSAGRVLFWAGYAEGAEARAFGFALTFYPSIVTLVAIVLSLTRQVVGS